MSRTKIPANKKRVKLNATIDSEIFKILNDYLVDSEIYNKSKYIELLIVNDLKKHKKLN